MTSSVQRTWRDRLGAAVCLPAALCSVLLGILPTSSYGARSLSAEPRQLSVRQQIEYAAQQGVVTLLLYEGMPISGRLSGFIGDWRDSTASEVHYKAWRATQSEPAPGAGEALTIVLASRDTLRGLFEGVTDEAITLRTGSSLSASSVRFADVDTLFGSEGGAFGPWSALRERLAGAPGLVAVRLEQGSAGSVLVSRSRIAQVTAVPLESSHAGYIVLIVVIGVLVVCAVSAANALDNLVFFPANSSVLDRHFGPATVSSGPAPWSRGETRRP